MAKHVDKIVCPYCGAEYVPAEIFLPISFTGKPKAIIKNDDYKIEDICGELPDTDEKFVCDKCNNLFSVHAKIFYQTSKTGMLNPNGCVTVQRKRFIQLEEE